MNNAVKANDLTFYPYLDEKTIQKRILELGKEIFSKYKDRSPIFIGILNGAFIFTADLVRACDLSCEITFTKLSSYSGTQSTGTVSTLIGLDSSLEGRHIIVVEDIIDSGRTMHHFVKELKSYKPASIALASLLYKPEAMQYDMHIDYVGFEIPDKFVIGYGLDYDGIGRNLASIYQRK
ncbi:MAG: hypoxanthine phosphoribosyltransferase [Bacteroidetes bacterium]|nr:hypoxanthine phosphoribosyltransferase [Bacteroidota bacterium]